MQKKLRIAAILTAIALCTGCATRQGAYERPVPQTVPPGDQLREPQANAPHTQPQTIKTTSPQRIPALQILFKTQGPLVMWGEVDGLTKMVPVANAASILPWSFDCKAVINGKPVLELQTSTSDPLMAKVIERGGGIITVQVMKEGQCEVKLTSDGASRSLKISITKGSEVVACEVTVAD